MSQKSLALTFPGYGVQHQGMLRDLGQHSDVRIELARLLDAAEALSGLQLAKIAESGPDSLLGELRVAWPLIFIADYLWGRHGREKGLRPQVLAGHDVGEFAALAHAGVVSATAALDLVVRLSKLLEDCVKDSDGATLVVLGLSAEEIAPLIAEAGVDGQVWISCDNSDDQVSLGGLRGALEVLIGPLTAAGARRALFAPQRGALNTPLVREVSERFRPVLEQSELRDAQIPVIMNATALTVMTGSEFRDPLASGVSQTIRWRDAGERIARMAPVICVESGPGSTLSDLNETSEQVEYHSLAQRGIINLLNRL